jgi:hypothetical protein
MTVGRVTVGLALLAGVIFGFRAWQHAPPGGSAAISGESAF